MSRQYKIPGEYPRVSQWTTQSFLLREAHATPCDYKEAGQILLALMGHFGVKVPLVEYEGKRRAMAYYPRKIVFPRVPLPPEEKQFLSGYLRVGVVLHEYAHFLKDHRERNVNSSGYLVLRTPSHGRFFVACLDEILLWYKYHYRAERVNSPISVAAEALDTSNAGKASCVANRSV